MGTSVMIKALKSSKVVQRIKINIIVKPYIYEMKDLLYESNYFITMNT